MSSSQAGRSFEKFEHIEILTDALSNAAISTHYWAEAGGREAAFDQVHDLCVVFRKSIEPTRHCFTRVHVLVLVVTDDPSLVGLVQAGGDLTLGLLQDVGLHLAVVTQ